jgi:hypothetical protein
VSAARCAARVFSRRTNRTTARAREPSAPLGAAGTVFCVVAGAVPRPVARLAAISPARFPTVPRATAVAFVPCFGFHFVSCIMDLAKTTSFGDFSSVHSRAGHRPKHRRTAHFVRG